MLMTFVDMLPCVLDANLQISLHSETNVKLHVTSLSSHEKRLLNVREMHDLILTRNKILFIFVLVLGLETIRQLVVDMNLFIIKNAYNFFHNI